jgi:hypothetical protein
MKQLYKKIVKICVAFILLGIFLSGCTTVQPWERGRLSKKIMIFDDNPIEKGILEHHIEYREGSSGATGSQSGGCGCG